MYSIVLMAAMTTGGEVPDFGRRGGGCCGCYGGGYGRYGGGYGCYGGGYGRGYGCYGGGGYGCWGGYGGYGGYRGGYGGYGGYAGSPYAPNMFGVSYGPPVGYTVQAPPTTTAPPGVAPATFVVNLPADAKLTVEGRPTTSTSSRRVFVSPPLRPGQTYSYSLDAQVTRDGQTQTVHRDLPVRAGQRSEITLDFPATTTTARR
jgi:uncharacterized protein (TIGR03000 family)